MTLPTYNHLFVSELINYAEGLPNEKIDEGLALPRESFIEDLQTFLSDMQTRRDYYYEEVENYHLIEYCINFLSVVKTDKGLRKILEILTEEEEFYDFWFSDFVEPSYVSFLLYDLFVDDFDALLEVLTKKEGTIFYLIRSGLLNIPAQVAIQKPKKRKEVIDFYKNLISFTLTNKKKYEDLSDLYFEVDSIIQSICLIEGKELRENILQLYDKGLANDMFQTKEDVLSELKNPTHSIQSNMKLKLDFTPYEIFEKSIYEEFTYPLKEEEIRANQKEEEKLENILIQSKLIEDNEDFEVDNQFGSISHNPKDLKSLYGRNDKVTVKYEDGKVIENTKYKKVEKDIQAGKCTIV